MSVGTINLKINGQDVASINGDTILKAAKEHGINIPTLCEFDGLTSLGGCRLCLVEVKGSPKLFPACTTPVSNGMEVTTESDRLKLYRKMALELILSERIHVCSVCVANNNCELQDLANKLGVDHVRFERNWKSRNVDSTHEFLVLDRNRCILCSRCVKVCDQIEGVHVLDLKMRGKDSEIIVELDDTWGNSKSCTSCRKCAKVCPVGSIYVEGQPIILTRDKKIAEFVLERRRK
jgi:bidirectional [NiFe] hydrogenase diaphorase subunit